LNSYNEDDKIPSVIARLLIHSNLETRVGELEQILTSQELKKDHPDVLWITDDQKLGVEAAKKIREHLSLKPFSAKGRVVIVESAQNLTDEAQNSLLKTLEEPPTEAVILLAADSEKKILPTILSRVQPVTLSGTVSDPSVTPQDDIQKLLEQTIEQLFEYVEKVEDKEAFFHDILTFFHANLASNPHYLEFTKELLKAEEWKDANGNIRAILEYLMLKLP
jgi:DNA polymerase III delta prime subunit